MVPRAPSSYDANREHYYQNASTGEYSEPWDHRASLPHPPQTQSSPPALPLLPYPPDFSSQVFGSPYEETSPQPRHRCRTSTGSTYHTFATYDSQPHHPSSTTSASPPAGTSPRSNAGPVHAAHQGRYFCPYVTCDSVIGNPSDLKRHILAKDEGRVQICTVCRCVYPRPYRHVICKGVKSSFEMVPWQRNTWGCGLCLECFKDFDKWVRHIVLHQQNEKKQKADWDMSLQLRSLLKNPDLVGLHGYSNSQIASMTWLDSDYIEVKQILETSRYRSPDQLQLVFELASPIRAQTHNWPAPNPSSASIGAGAPQNPSLAFDDELEMNEAMTVAFQPNVHTNLPPTPDNVGWEKRNMSPQRTENTLRGLDEEIAGVAGSSNYDHLSMPTNESQTTARGYGNYLELRDDDRNSLGDIFAMSEFGATSHFDDALGEEYRAPD